jgi:molybdopterin synthase sulfur carrier subunit
MGVGSVLGRFRAGHPGQSCWPGRRCLAGLNDMAETTAMSTVHFHYWAGAKAAAGRAEEAVEAGTVREALDAVSARHPDAHFRRVVRACSVLVDGAAAHEAELDRPLTGPVRVELLPPFAGGATG